MTWALVEGIGGAPLCDVGGAEFVIGDEAQRDGERGHRMFGDAGRIAGRVAVGEDVADVGLVDHVGAAVMVGFREADVDVDAEGFGDFPAEVLTECAAGDAADDLAEDEAEAHHVIALAVPGCHQGSAVAIWRQTQSHASVSDGVSRMRGPMTPERWPSTVAMVMSCFPAWTNSGK